MEIKKLHMHLLLADTSVINVPMKKPERKMPKVFQRLYKL